MGIKEVMHCDVFGTTRNVQQVKVAVWTVHADCDTVIHEAEVDLSERALTRLLGFIRRGTTPTKSVANESQPVESGASEQ